MVVVKLPGIMSGSIMFQNIIVYYGIVLVDCKIKGINRRK